MKAITEKSADEVIVNALKDFLRMADFAESLEFSVNIAKGAIPTVSYKVNGYQVSPQQFVKTEDVL